MTYNVLSGTLSLYTTTFMFCSGQVANSTQAKSISWTGQQCIQYTLTAEQIYNEHKIKKKPKTEKLMSSIIFHPCSFLPIIPLLHFPLVHFQRSRRILEAYSQGTNAKGAVWFVTWLHVKYNYFRIISAVVDVRLK